MDNCVWDDEYWATLIYTIKQNDCILMLGPDASVEQVNGHSRPLAEVLANRLSEKIKPELREKIDNSSLAQVSMHYYMDTGKNDLRAKVADFYGSMQNQTSELHRNLAALPFYFTVTASPDNMFATALKEKQKDPVISSYHFQGKKPDLVTMGTPEKPLIYHLYGTLEEPKSLAITEGDLLDFLVAVISKDPPLPDNITTELNAGNKSLLFIGFGFRNWYLRILLHVLHGGKKRDSRSFALEQFMPKNMDEYQNTILFFRTCDYKIHIFHNELNWFVKELKERYYSSSPGCISKASLMDAPTVFICYAEEDKDFAVSLYERFEKAHIRPWLDEKNLRGGEAWKSVIKSTIDDVDYVLVLQSSSLVNKGRGYVYKEIRLALEREQCTNPNHIFIIPGTVGDCPRFEMLEHLQHIDLSVEENIQKVISMIKKDQQRRKKG
ncbi:MAG: toll/interleukin-1 receptor domain-containing protein [Desulfobacteraceae bacterium]|nr:toll/interleukin-1 receptor domain-containing protein [Desulfobacteraceae bacterium]